MFVISMASHLFVLSKVDLSFAYPFLSLAYVIVAVVAWFLFKEELGAYKIAGIALIYSVMVLLFKSVATRLQHPKLHPSPEPIHETHHFRR